MPPALNQDLLGSWHIGCSVAIGRWNANKAFLKVLKSVTTYQCGIRETASWLNFLKKPKRKGQIQSLQGFPLSCFHVSQAHIKAWLYHFCRPSCRPSCPCYVFLTRPLLLKMAAPSTKTNSDMLIGLYVDHVAHCSVTKDHSLDFR